MFWQIHTYLNKYKSLKVPRIIIYLFTGLLKETLFTNFLFFYFFVYAAEKMLAYYSPPGGKSLVFPLQEFLFRLAGQIKPVQHAMWPF